MFIRADSRLYRSQSSGCHGARRAARIASLYARDKRATGDPNLRSLHNCRSGGGWCAGCSKGEGGGEQRVREIYNSWWQELRPIRPGLTSGFDSDFFFLSCFSSLQWLVRLHYQDRSWIGIGVGRDPWGSSSGAFIPISLAAEEDNNMQLSPLQPLISLWLFSFPPAFAFFLCSTSRFSGCLTLLHAR